MKTLARKCSRARFYSPEVLQKEYVRAAFECVDWDDTEEVMTLFYMAKDLVQGRRKIPFHVGVNTLGTEREKCDVAAVHISYAPCWSRRISRSSLWTHIYERWLAGRCLRVWPHRAPYASESRRDEHKRR